MKEDKKKEIELVKLLGLSTIMFMIILVVSIIFYIFSPNVLIQEGVLSRALRAFIFSLTLLFFPFTVIDS